MTSPVSEIITARFAPATQTVLYTSPSGVVTRLDKISVTNVTGAVALISINLVPFGGTVGSSNLTTSNQAIQANSTFNSPNEYGHCLNAGDSISVIAGTASALVIAVAGTQLT